MKVAVLFCFLIPFGIYAQLGGSSSYTFLNLTPSARNAALGNSNIAKNKGLSNVLINPASLSASDHLSISLTYFNYFNGINYGLANYAYNFKKLGTIHFAMQFANYGKFIEADETSVITGEFKSADYAFNVSYAKPLRADSNLMLGGNFKFIYSNYYLFNSLAIALDASFLYKNPQKQFATAALIKNAGIPLKQYYSGSKSSLPLDVQFGISQGLAHVPINFFLNLTSLQKPNLNYTDSAKLITNDPLTGLPVKQKVNYFDYAARHIIAGAEISPVKNFAIRIAYDYRKRQELKIDSRPGLVGFSFGIGFKTKKFSFDFGRTQFHRAGASNVFTFTYNISGLFNSPIKPSGT
jgi:hypothetical protein